MLFLSYNFGFSPLSHQAIPAVYKYSPVGKEGCLGDGGSNNTETLFQLWFQQTRSHKLLNNDVYAYDIVFCEGKTNIKFIQIYKHNEDDTQVYINFVL